LPADIDRLRVLQPVRCFSPSVEIDRAHIRLRAHRHPCDAAARARRAGSLRVAALVGGVLVFQLQHPWLPIAGSTHRAHAPAAASRNRLHNPPDERPRCASSPRGRAGFFAIP